MNVQAKMGHFSIPRAIAAIGSVGILGFKPGLKKQGTRIGFGEEAGQSLKFAGAQLIGAKDFARVEEAGRV